MRYATTIFLLFLSAVLFSGCEKDVNIDLPYEGNKIVLNTLITSDSLMYARITNSTELRSNTNFPIPPGARIDLYENDVLRETMTQRTISGTVFFTSTVPARKGRKYTFKASATGLSPAEGSDIVPAKPSFFGEEFTPVTVNGNLTYRLKIRLSDPPGEKNYYRIRLYGADTNTTGAGPAFFIQKNIAYYFSINNFSTNNNSTLFGNETYFQYYFSDDTFDGREVTLVLDVDFYGASTHLAPEMVQLTRDAYRYLQSRENQRNNEGNPFAEAVVVYNNITGGYGIVGAMADSLTVVRIR